MLCRKLAAGRGRLDARTLERILTEKRGLWSSHLTVISGGEPFLWRDGDYGLLELFGDHPDEFFLVFTNGLCVDDRTAARLGALGNVTLSVSVEGLREQTDARRGAGVHGQVLAAFARLREAGVPFGVSTTPMQTNWETIASDEFVDFYFEQQGAVYGWMFQYMPIGRGPACDRMLTPEQRVELLRRTERIVRQRKVFLVDFANTAPVTSGCISAGRPGGYLYIDWDGNVMPCVFVPYAAANIHDVYAAGGDLDTVLQAPFFRCIRDWQNAYGYTRDAGGVGNWYCPCPNRDHFPVLQEAIRQTEPRPVGESAQAALTDAGYAEAMTDYGRRINALTAPIWQRMRGDG